MRNIQAKLEKALEIGREAAKTGEVASYIPELSKVDPSLMGISLRTLDGEHFHAGNIHEQVTFQSAGKVFVLARVLRDFGMNLFDKVNYEPSGDPFSSMVRLEDEQGRPRNPYINSGAILVASHLQGRSSDDKIKTMLDFLTELCPKGQFSINEPVYQSEAKTGFRNRAMANFLKQYDLIEDVDLAVDTYFKTSAININLNDMSRIGLFLANKGINPLNGKRVISETCCRTTVSLMASCGMYDQTGDVAIRIGLPCKSSVSGIIFVVVPGKMVISVLSPPLGPKGNSAAGMKMLEYLSQQLELSIYG